MADGKEKLSFLLYKNQRVLFDNLTDEQAGKLIKQIFKYVNCENPDETNDAMVNYGFAMIKANLELDLEKWKDIKKKRTDAINKRWSNTNDTKEYKSIQENTNDTVNVKVNVNDNVNVNGNVKVNVKKEDKSSLDNIIYICLEIPLNDGTLGKITEEEFNLWKETYPGIDVEYEIRKMISWSNANPKNRKTKSGYKRFINSWLARAQDSAPVKKESATPPGVKIGVNL